MKGIRQRLFVLSLLVILFTFLNISNLTFVRVNGTAISLLRICINSFKWHNDYNNGKKRNG